jgi:hypothetical protein
VQSLAIGPSMLIPDHSKCFARASAELYEEKKRTGIFNVSNAAYPVLARNLRARRNNLLVTIATLQSQLVEAAV